MTGSTVAISAHRGDTAPASSACLCNPRTDRQTGGCGTNGFRWEWWCVYRPTRN